MDKMTKDTIIHIKKSGNRVTYYRSFCNICGKDKGYVPKGRVNKTCRECLPGPNKDRTFDEAHRKKLSSAKIGKTSPRKGAILSKETKDKISLAKIGRSVNKGAIRNEETRKKISNALMGRPSVTKGRTFNEETKKRMSCGHRKIDIADFNDFLTPETDRARAKFQQAELHIKCFERDNYTCNICSIKGGTLNAHHANSWKDFPEQRFDINNLVTLCQTCHNKFHYAYSKSRPNTKEQYLEFKTIQVNKPKKVVYLLTGCPASGKTWVANQLKEKFGVVDADVIPKKTLFSVVESTERPLLALTVGVSTTLTRNPTWDIKLIVIQEPKEVVVERMIRRGGKVTNTIERRIKRMDMLAKIAIFVGTSNEVLTYLTNIDDIITSYT